MLDVADDLEAENIGVPFNEPLNIGAGNSYMVDRTVCGFLDQFSCNSLYYDRLQG
ncbi:hypothetical protein BFJ66_g10425 [Fusarium oxysporum f. sp. cepae]|nr:hypothetical protein BFJ65_g13957 [Fusarium oxysporum f. sp. cepae]RKK42512.1 hypothetical protein BFJ66_g10425 [Fusarium oxysporum f. sp. cepae]RKK61189.1 hypothetical protein BFJ67_g1904 [Fusarium oxysporum f. sp. cepae]RKK95923.1 hypothetical protein BFJ71_g8099 [Fusarium oxysporum]